MALVSQMRHFSNRSNGLQQQLLKFRTITSVPSSVLLNRNFASLATVNKAPNKRSNQIDESWINTSSFLNLKQNDSIKINLPNANLNRRLYRFFSTTSNNSSTVNTENFKESDADRQHEAEQETRTQMAVRKLWAGAWIGGTALSIGATWMATKYVMYTIGAIYAQPHIIAYIGFWTGVGSTSLIAALAFAVYRMTHIRPENVFNQTSKLIKENKAAQALLGGNKIQTAKLKSYEITGGQFGLKGASNTVSWMPHVCQMTYMVYGQDKMVLVTTKCTKVMSLVPGRLSIDLLALDVLDKSKIDSDQETLMIFGKQEDLTFKNSIYNMLELKLECKEGKLG